MSGPDFSRPYLCSISGATEQTEFADAIGGLFSANGYPLASDYSLGSLAPNVAHTLVEAGFTLHHRDRHDPLYRVRGSQGTEAR